MPTKKENNQKPLTLNDLAQFSEEVLLPAVNSLIQEEGKKIKIEIKGELNERLKPIEINIEEMKMDIKDIKKNITSLEVDVSNLLTLDRFDRFKKYNGLQEEHEVLTR